MRPNSTVVIGAGPYGLSVAAHLRGWNVPTRVFGKPMEFWQNMPAGLHLKSPWSASSLRDPAGAYSLKRFVSAVEASPGEPIPLPFFLRYGQWFQQSLVPDVDPTYVRCLVRERDGFQIELGDGRTVEAARVVVATGIQDFAHTPEFARDLPPDLCSHTQAQTDVAAFRERRVAVVGNGQSALEWAGLLHDSGARVELFARRQVHWVNRTLYDRTGPARRLFYPPTDVGPPGINWIIAFPLLMRLLPVAARSTMYRRAVRPAGAKWLRTRVEGRVTITPFTSIQRATERGRELRIELSDGTTRDIDYLFLGTGYRPDLQRIPFLDPALRQGIRQRNGFPVLNQWFESSVSGLYFAGGVAGYSFGPLCNFVAGAGVAARQVARHAAQAA